MHVCVCVCVCICVRMYMSVCVRARVYVRVCIYTKYVHIYRRVYVCVCIYTKYVHIYIGTRTRMAVTRRRDKTIRRRPGMHPRRILLLRLVAGEEALVTV